MKRLKSEKELIKYYSTEKEKEKEDDLPQEKTSHHKNELNKEDASIFKF